MNTKNATKEKNEENRCKPKRFGFRFTRNSYPTILFAVAAVFLSWQAAGFDYSEPMPCVKGLPLDAPEMPFVLRFTEEELLAQPIWSKEIDGIIIPKNTPSPIRLGADALRATIVKYQLGEAPFIEMDANQAELPIELEGNRFIVLGTPQDFKLAEMLAKEANLDVTDEALNGDGFHIKPVKQGKQDVLLITSPMSRGVMYGAYELDERTTKRGVPRIDDVFVPSMRYRGWSIFNGIPALYESNGRWRDNISSEYSAWWPHVLPYKEYPELGGEANHTYISEQASRLHDVFVNAAKRGSMPAFTLNPLSLQWTPCGLEAARKVLSEEYPGILAQPADKYPYSLCPSHPETRRFVASMAREFVETFPETELLILQMSDEGGEVLCDCEQCKKTPYYERLIDYINLTISTARAVNPKMKFILFGSGICNKISMYDPQLGSDPNIGLKTLYNRVGGDIEFIMLMATSPPGFDVQTWFSPDSTMLGQGVPLYYLLNWYEAGWPGIAIPISPVMSHLSWPLPLYLERYKKFTAPGSGTIGADSPVAGMNVAFWDRNLDPQKYMKNWCQAKFGKEAGDYAYKALVDTDKITSAFYLDTKPNVNESFDMYRWGACGQPWAVNMDSLANAGFEKDLSGQTTFESIATLGFMFPQAPRPDAFKTLARDTMAPWVKRFELSEETAIGDRAAALMAKALKHNPDNKDLQRLDRLARGTKALVHLFREYHLAMVYASAARNDNDSMEKSRLVEQARTLLKQAAENVEAYRASMLPITKDETVHMRMKRDTEILYVTAAACIVREAAYLFDQEFGGESVLAHFDQAMGLTERP